MDFIMNILIALWVVIEAIMFLLEANEAACLAAAEEVNLEFLNDLDNDGTESFDSIEFKREHHGDDSGVVCLRGGSNRPPTNEIDKKQRQLLLAKRLARRDQDRKIILAYFDNIKLDGQMEIEDEAEDGYDSDYDTSQSELVELLVRMAEYIRWHKIVSLYDLSHKFQLSVKKTHEQLEQLQMIGLLQGVYDDRGKFAYVAETELRAVAEFIAEHNLNNWPQLGFI